MATSWLFVFAFAFAFAAPQAWASDCDPAERLAAEEKDYLISRLSNTPTGQALLQGFQKKYSSHERVLEVFWSQVSYSQLAGDRVCVYLAKQLPEIENLADFAHELTHAVYLDGAVLRGEVATAEAFVEGRLRARGGEADAFATECHVKFETTGEWDSLCSPYVTRQTVLKISSTRKGRGRSRGIASDAPEISPVLGEESMDQERVFQDLTSGKLSASLTGEPYPVMLKRQFESMRRGRAKSARHLK